MTLAVPHFLRSAGVTRGADVGLVEIVALEQERHSVVPGLAFAAMASWQNHPIRSRAFQLFLLRTYYRKTGNSPGAQAIRATLELLEDIPGLRFRTPGKIVSYRQ